MIIALLVSQVISWLVIVALLIALLAIARQVGVLHTRVAPAGALTPLSGPAVGDRSPVHDLITIDGAHLTIGDTSATNAMVLLMFVSPQCPICKELIPVVKSFARRESIKVVFMGDDKEAHQRQLIADYGIGDIPFVNNREAGRAFHVDKLPHAVLLDKTGHILAKGLVNSREHLESLVIAHEMGFRSIQDYISSLTPQAA